MSDIPNKNTTAIGNVNPISIGALLLGGPIGYALSFQNPNQLMVYVDTGKITKITVKDMFGITYREATLVEGTPGSGVSFAEFKDLPDGVYTVSGLDPSGSVLKTINVVMSFIAKHTRVDWSTPKGGPSAPPPAEM